MHWFPIIALTCSFAINCIREYLIVGTFDVHEYALMFLVWFISESHLTGPSKIFFYTLSGVILFFSLVNTVNWVSTQAALEIALATSIIIE